MNFRFLLLAAAVCANGNQQPNNLDNSNTLKERCGDLPCKIIDDQIVFTDLGETSYNISDPTIAIHPVEYEDRNSKADKDGLIKNTLLGPVKGLCNHGFYYGLFHNILKCSPVTSRAWIGIPYAVPPVGDLRFKPPQPLTDGWHGKVRKAIHPVRSCLQKTVGKTSEDCLYLNVYAPPVGRVQGKGLLPVLLWLHGGGFNFGSGRQMNLYDGRHWTRSEDVIVVTFNYRLGPMGFFVGDGKDGEQIKGYMGIEDQRLAMKWVQDNIANFGGDPKQVTLVGESAGATSVLIHMLSDKTPSAHFQRAVMQSLPLAIRSKPLDEMKAVGLEWARNMSCIGKGYGNKEVVDLACLRRVNKKKINKSSALLPDAEQKDTNQPKLSDMFYWWPHVDGDNLTDEPLTLIRQGKFKKVPVMIGTLRDEAGFFTAKNDGLGSRLLIKLVKSYKKDHVASVFNNAFGKHAAEVFKYYPLSDDEYKNESQYVALATDFTFICPSLEAAGHFGKQQPTYYYSIDRVAKFATLGRCGKDFACHTWDLPLFWRPRMLPMKTKDKIMSREFIKYTSNFIMTSDPNVFKPGAHSKHQYRLVNWERFSAAKHNVLSLTLDPGMKTCPRAEFCQLWNRLGYHF